MAHVYVCESGADADGGPSMYFYFDDKSPKAVAFMEELLVNSPGQEAAPRFRNICRPTGGA